MNLKKGISAIIPSYKGESHISKLLNSIKNQTLDLDLFEVIFIINGELDSTAEIIKEFKKNNPNINIVLDFSDLGVCNARNYGIELATKEYVVFIDDDDYISPKYFEKLYEYSKPNRIVIGTFFDVNEDTGEIQSSYLTPPLLNSSGIIKNPYAYMPDILVITTDKLIPTKAIKSLKFNSDLKNGVDISYYARFYPEHDFEFYLIDKKEEAIYYRLLRSNSISRQPLSYDFNISDRLKVISDINNGLKKAKTQEMRSFIESLTGGQVEKINKYLKECPEDLEKVLHDINRYNFEFFPYKYFDEDFNELNQPNSELIISYGFPPSNTTTGNVMAKRILTNKKNVDVICGSLKNIDTDLYFEKIVNQFIINKIVIDIPFSIDWNNIKEFVSKGIDQLKNMPPYKKIYSRSYFQHSHFLAFEYKLKNPNTHWSAEFSDPTIYNFEGKENSPPINDYEYVNKVNKYLPEKFKKINEKDSINFVSEYLAFIFADEIIFTNENQKKVMIDLFPYTEIEDIVNKKSKINKHPTLDKKYYYMKESSYEIDDSYVNFAYFGVIFGKRTLEDVIIAFNNIDKKFKDKYKIHLFTPNKTMFEQILPSDILEKTIINPQVSFLEFLNLSTKFNVLIVNDSQTKDVFIANPFLPSKSTDYSGSGTSIWAICEKNSIMDNNMNIEYKSRLNDFYSNKNTLNQIMLNKLSLKNEDLDDKNFLKIASQLFKDSYETDLSKVTYENLPLLIEEDKKAIEYLRKRSTHFSKKIDELIQVAENEFNKDKIYEDRIRELEEENNKMKTSNSWKLTKNFRRIRKKFK